MAETTATLADALAGLRRRQEAHPDLFEPGATDEDIAKANASLSVPIPAAWQKVLKVSNGFVLRSAQYLEAGWVSEIHDEERDFVREQAPQGSLIIAEDASGDVVILDAKRQTADGDCPVIWIAHDCPEDWDGQYIAAFLLMWIKSDDMRQVYDDDPDEDDE